MCSAIKRKHEKLARSAGLLGLFEILWFDCSMNCGRAVPTLWLGYSNIVVLGPSEGVLLSVGPF